MPPDPQPMASNLDCINIIFHKKQLPRKTLEAVLLTG